MVQPASEASYILIFYSSVTLRTPRSRDADRYITSVQPSKALSWSSQSAVNKEGRAKLKAGWWIFEALLIKGCSVRDKNDLLKDLCTNSCMFGVGKTQVFSLTATRRQRATRWAGRTAWSPTDLLWPRSFSVWMGIWPNSRLCLMYCPLCRSCMRGTPWEGFWSSWSTRPKISHANEFNFFLHPILLFI